MVIRSSPRSWPDGYPEVGTLTPADPPEHTRYRRLINRSFTPKAVGVLEPSIRVIVDELIDDFLGDGRCEFVSQFSNLLPATVIADALGVPRDRIPDALRWARAIEDAVALDIPRERALEAKREYVEFQLYFADMIEERRQNPGTDLVSDLVTAGVRRGAAARRTRDARPDQGLHRRRQPDHAGTADERDAADAPAPRPVQGGPRRFSLIPQMVEEVLRYESPAQWLPRTIEAPGGVTLGDTHIPEGKRAALLWGAANRDEDVFKDPDKFDIFRDDVNDHIALGFGTHFCVGAALGRAEGRIAFEQLFSRLADIECEIPVEQVEYKTSPMDRGVKSLPLQLPHCVTLAVAIARTQLGDTITAEAASAAASLARSSSGRGEGQR